MGNWSIARLRIVSIEYSIGTSFVSVDFCFGSLAARRHPIILTTAICGKANVQTALDTPKKTGS
jgi:hypothetical protein